MNKDNKKNSTEDILKQKLEGFELPVEDFVFEAIESEIAPTPLQPKRKQRVLFWAAASIIALVLIAFIFNPFDKSSTQNSNTTSTNTETSGQLPKNLGEVPIDEETAKRPESEIILVDDDLKPDISKSKKGEDTPDFKQPTHTVVTIPNALASPMNVSTKKTDPSVATKMSNKNALELPSTQYTSDSEVNLSNVQNSTTNSFTKDLSDTPVLNTVVDDQSSENLIAVDALHNNSTITPPLNESETPDLLATVVFNDSLDSPNVVSSDSIPINMTSEKRALSSLSKFSLQALVGVGVSYRILKSSAYEELQTHKNNYESYGFTFSYGLGMQYHINDALYAGLGLGYASYSERYDFQHDSISHSTVNTYTYIQVPLMLGVRLFETKRLTFYGQVGMVWNSLTAAQSSWIDPNSLLAVSHSNKNQENPFRKNAFQSTVGLDIAMKLNNRWRVNLIPSANIFLNSVYLESTNLDQKPYSGFLNIGITKRF